MKLNGVQQKIYWDVLFLMLLGALGINSRWFFVFSIIYYAYLLLKNKGKMYMPKVCGIKAYLFFVFYGTFVGLILHSMRNVLRDLYYILPTLVWIFIGYHLRIKKCDEKKCMITTISIYGAIVSASCFVEFLFEPTLVFGNLRTVFGTGVYEVGFILPIMIMESFVLKKNMISKIMDRVMIIIMTLQIILSFGRMAILEPIIMMSVLFVLLAIYKKEHTKIAIRLLGIIGSLVLVFLIIYSFIPENVMKIFAEKVLYTAEEVDISQEITSTSESMSSWRAYEIQSAQEQWRDSNFLVKVFGAGLGKGVSIKFVPHSWKGMVVDNEIPLLHNGFYTLLPNGGVLAVVSLGMLLLGNALKGLRAIKKNRFQESNGIVLVGLSIAAIATTYVLCGPVKK